MKTFKNKITVSQLSLLCEQYETMLEAKFTPNVAIRLVELCADIYGKVRTGGNPGPHSVWQVRRQLWSKMALIVLSENPGLQDSKSKMRPKEFFRVEHGTPKRKFAEEVIELHRTSRLSQRSMDDLTDRYWRVAVITLDEDKALSRIGARSRSYKTPESRWAAAGIEFADNAIDAMHQIEVEQIDEVTIKLLEDKDR